VTEHQSLVAQALERCSMLPCTAEKRFARDMAFRSRHPAPSPLTARQAKYLEQLAWKFRRQMPPSLVPAEKPA